MKLGKERFGLVLNLEDINVVKYTLDFWKVCLKRYNISNGNIGEKDKLNYDNIIATRTYNIVEGKILVIKDEIK